MASSLAILLRRLSYSPSLSRAVRQSSAAPQRLFGTRAKRDFDEEDEELDADRRRGRRISGRSAGPVYGTDSFKSIRSLNLADQLVHELSLPETRGWGAKDTDEGVEVCIDMPGLGKEDVKVTVEKSSVILKGVEPTTGRRYSGRFGLPENVFMPEMITAEMKNGVLKVVLPKLREEETDVFHVNVEGGY